MPTHAERRRVTLLSRALDLLMLTEPEIFSYVTQVCECQLVLVCRVIPGRSFNRVPGPGPVLSYAAGEGGEYGKNP